MCGSDIAAFKILGKRLNQSQGKNPRNKMGITTTVVRCNNCGLIFANPLPVPENLQNHYGIEPDDYWKEDYFVLGEDYFKQEIETLRSLTSFAKGSKALDIGAGLGKCMIALTKAGFDTYGIEPSKNFYNAAIERMKIDPDRLKVSSIEAAEFPDNYFEFITFGAVLEHFYNPSESINKAMRWLKKDGIIQIEVPSSDWMINKILNAFYKIQGLDYVANISPMHEPFHLYEFSLKSFQDNAALNGYDIIHHEYYVAKTYMPRIIDWIIVPIMRMMSTGMQLCVWLRKK